MEILLTLLTKLLPLYLLILLGYLFGKVLKIKKELFAYILIYGIIPIVLFTSVAGTSLTLGTLSIPLLFFLLASFISLLSLWFAGFIWKDFTKHILAYVSGSANTGYFGLPVAVVLLGQNAVPIVALSVLGTSLYSNSLGFFVAAKGHHTTKESLVRVAKLPMLYAFFLGVIANITHIDLRMINSTITPLFINAFIVFGMMLIGIALAEMKKLAFDYKFIGFTLFAKYIIWPVIMAGFILLDKNLFHLFNDFTYQVFLVMAIVPLAANMVSYATLLKMHPEKASMAVLVSTFVAVVYVPLFIFFFLSK